MRWPEWTNCFGRCCGARQGPHHKHYDAWLARERLNQVKRLEIRLADLTRENGELSGRLSQAVGILDSYHSFDLDQIALATQAAGLSLPPAPDALRQDSASRRRLELPGAPGSHSGSEVSQGRSSQRSGSLAPTSPAGLSHRMAMSRASMGGSALIGNSVPSPSPQGRVGSLQFQPTNRTAQAPPPRVRQMMSGERAASVGQSRRNANGSKAVGIPSREELDELLRRSEPARRSNTPERPSRPSMDTVIEAAPPARRTAAAEDAISVASAPTAQGPSPLPTIGEGSDELRQSSVEYERPQASSDGERPAEPGLARRRSRDGSRLKSRHSGGRDGVSVDQRRGSFSFSTPPAPSQDSPRQMMLPPRTSAFHDAAQMVPPSLPAVMVGDNTQPVRAAPEAPVKDVPKLATQARGQIYTSHYSPESSPFARAAARMPSPDGKMPLSRHLPPN